MRAVLDTNILISACWTPTGNEAQILARARAGQLEIALSPAIEAEYADVAARPKFVKHRPCLEAAIRALKQLAIQVQPAPACQACPDPDDNQLLDCAHAAQAGYLITGNLRHFPVSWHGVQIVNARAFLNRHPEP